MSLFHAQQINLQTLIFTIVTLWYFHDLTDLCSSQQKTPLITFRKDRSKEQPFRELGCPHAKRARLFFHIFLPAGSFILFCLISRECWKLYGLFPRHEQCLKYLLCIKYFSRQSTSFQHSLFPSIGFKGNKCVGHAGFGKHVNNSSSAEFPTVRWSLLTTMISWDVCDTPQPWHWTGNRFHATFQKQLSIISHQYRWVSMYWGVVFWRELILEIQKQHFLVSSYAFGSMSCANMLALTS